MGKMAVLRGRFRGAVADHLERLFGSGTSTGLTEGQLLDRFASGRDEAAFVALVERHGPMVLAVCRQFLRDPNDVDDAFQATFLVLVRKAGTLRRKELLGNWLYGVACRVSLRARCAASRRSSRFTAAQDLELIAADRRWPRGGMVAASVQDDGGPLLHEEVNRLPPKYRTPIVLCYFEGLTHDQAAARLGWPVGTVKGRLARARDLLRPRLARRGVMISASALAADLASPDARASVPAWLIHSTLRGALSALSGTGLALPASPGVPLSVTSLSEGVLHAMVLSQVKAIVLPVLLSIGVLTTAATVVAYQGKGRGPSRRRAEIPQAQAPRPPGVPTVRLDLSVESDIQTARSVLENLRKTYSQGAEGAVIDPLQYNNWSLNLLVSEMLANDSDDGRRKALEGHRDRLAALIQELSPLAEKGKIPKGVMTALENQRKRAEAMLAWTHPFQGGMSGMMAAMAGSAKAGGGGGALEGGGFGGGGPEPRIEIARMSAVMSTLDRSPRNQAIIEKLDEPITLHFATETPLSEVLKHIKEHFKGPDGKKLPIYVDPQGLTEADRTEKSPVTIDLEDIPLRFSLRLLLKQLGLAYCVRDGVVIISSVEGIQQELEEAESEQRVLQEFTRSQ
jgi:RNA polymerase sigma factor (sigma-70 family)